MTNLYTPMNDLHFIKCYVTYQLHKLRKLGNSVGQHNWTSIKLISC